MLIGARHARLVRDAVQGRAVRSRRRAREPGRRHSGCSSVDPQAAAIARRLDTPLIGRAGPSSSSCIRRSSALSREQPCHLFTLLGSAGVGKSRLVAEFLAGIDATVVVSGSCLDYGEGITLWPVIAILKQLGARADPAIAVGSSTGAVDIRTSSSGRVRRTLEEIAAERPLVVVFDDIQWGEPTFLDLVDHIADLSRGAPILAPLRGAPGAARRAPGLGRRQAERDDDPARAAVGGRVRRADRRCTAASTRDASTRILTAADGNPLFVEEMVALVHESGDVRVPSTVQALLQARLDQLDRRRARGDRARRRRGPVLPPRRRARAHADGRRGSTPQLIGLVRKELIRPDAARHSPATHAYPVPPSADPRRGVRRAAERDAGRPARTVRGLARRACARAHRARRGARLPPRAGRAVPRELGQPTPTSRGARPARLGAAGSKASAAATPRRREPARAGARAASCGDPGRRAPDRLDRYARCVERPPRDLLRRIDELERRGRPGCSHARASRPARSSGCSPIRRARRRRPRVADQALALFASTGDDLGVAQRVRASCVVAGSKPPRPLAAYRRSPASMPRGQDRAPRRRCADPADGPAHLRAVHDRRGPATRVGGAARRLQRTRIVVRVEADLRAPRGPLRRRVAYCRRGHRAHGRARI